jgi:hypothetical protein
MPQLLTSVSRAARFKAALLIITNSAVKGKIFSKNIFYGIFRKFFKLMTLIVGGGGSLEVLTPENLFQQAAAFSKTHKIFC